MSFLSVGGAESGSEHPLASAIVNYVKQALDVNTVAAKVTDFQVRTQRHVKLFVQTVTVNYQAIPGCGLRVKVSELESMLHTDSDDETEGGKNMVDYRIVRDSLPYG